VVVRGSGGGGGGGGPKRRNYGFRSADLCQTLEISMSPRATFRNVFLGTLHYNRTYVV